MRRKLTYWIGVAKISGVADVRKPTRSAVKAVIHKSEHEKARKVEVWYEDLIDLINKLSEKRTNIWEKI